MESSKPILYCLLALSIACIAGGCAKKEKPVEVDPKAVEAALDGQVLELEEETLTMTDMNIQRFRVQEVTRIPDSPHVCVSVCFEYIDRGKTLAVDGTVSYEETAEGMKDARFETSEVGVQ
jgi:hypothetical protein